MQGRIKFFKPENGWGFIVPDQSSLGDFFFHFRDMAVVPLVDREQIFQPGTRVEFEPSKGPDGRDRAVNVQLVKLTMTDIHGNAAPVGRYTTME